MGHHRSTPWLAAKHAGNTSAEPTPADAGWRTWPAPIRDKRWVDPQGIRWHLRGGPLTAKQARRLFRRPDVAVLHVYGLDPRQVTGSERDALIDKIELFFAGAAPPMADFAIAEFRNDLHQVMLVVQEYC